MPFGIFLLGAPSEAKKLAKQASKGELPGSVSLKGMCLIDIVTLCNALDPAYDSIGLLANTVRVGHGEAVPIPLEIHLRISRLEEREIPSLAENWSKAEEFRGLISAEDLAVFLGSLVEVARKGISEKHPLLFINL